MNQNMAGNNNLTITYNCENPFLLDIFGTMINVLIFSLVNAISVGAAITLLLCFSVFNVAFLWILILLLGVKLYRLSEKMEDDND